MSDQFIISGDDLTFMYSLFSISDQQRLGHALANLKSRPSTEDGKETFEGLCISTARQILAYHVARGEQTAAETMFTQGINPELALEPTEITGYQAATKPPASINTAVKYAAWARDHEILWMIIDKIEAISNIAKRAELITELLKQFKEIPERFSLKPLKDAYKKFLAEIAALSTSGDMVAYNEAWLAIGIEQSKLPPNYAQYYCNPRLPFYPRPDVNQLYSRETAGIRSEMLDFDYYSAGRAMPQHWYTDAGLGVNFIIFRGGGRVWVARDATGGMGCDRGFARADLAAMEVFDRARTLEVLEIDSYLTSQLDLNSSIAVAPSSRPAF